MFKDTLAAEEGSLRYRFGNPHIVMKYEEGVDSIRGVARKPREFRVRIRGRGNRMVLGR